MDREKSKVLILDDDKLVTTTLSFLLQSQTDYEIFVFNSPFEALSYVQENDVDLIISDFLMPELNGIEFLSEVKKIRPSVTMILLTGYADKENAIKAINEVGLYKYIEKPWDNDELLINIKNGLERSELVATIKMQKEIERLRNDFIATLTHDLRTPLLAAIQTLEYFLDGSIDTVTEKQTKFLSTMLHSNQDMLGLVNALLEVYRYESGNFKLYKDKFNLSELTLHCCEEVKSLLEKKNLKLIKDFPDNITVNADKQEIRRVIANFLGNSIVHSPEDGVVTAKIQEESKYLTFSIQDTGRGIPKEDIHKIFNRFSQGTSAKRSSGTGLGLYLSRQIIDAHNGEIWLESEVDKGSTFYFKLRK
ncbi:MAG: hybrid sensor histidine kinase/response regulator [Candidatus Gastranaerophilales bacterium]|nr:hybrid sensor histidine kinase/response regulator [Candidatus Gastranaerophilales bacterium]